MKIRIKFRRFGCMKFLGHLDMMRYFQREIRRANIDVKYSEGFSPHQVMSFAAPLGVGITSDGEYFDIEVNSAERSSADTIASMNAVSVEGIEVTGYVVLPEKAKTAMSIVAAADYLLYYKEGFASPYTTEEWKEIIDRTFLSRDTFEIVKKTARSEKTLDLKQLVYRLEIVEKDGKPAFSMQICTGSTNNLKPEFALTSICEAAGIELDLTGIQIHRVETYCNSEKGLIPLLEQGKEIV